MNTKNMDLIYVGDLRDIQGVNKVIQSLLDSKNIFKKNGIVLNQIISAKHVFNCSNIDEIPIGVNINTTKYKRNRKIRTLLRDNFVSHNKFYDWLKIKINYIWPAKKIIKCYMKNEKFPEIIMFHDVFSAYYFLKKNIQNNINVKTLYIIHSIDNEPFKQLFINHQHLKGTRYERKLLQIRDFVISRVNKCIYVSKPYGLNIKVSNKYDYVYNGIKDKTVIKKDYNNKDHFKIVSVGSVIFRKGQDLLIDALNIMDKEIIDKIDLTIVGAGSELEELINQTNKFNLSNKVYFLGARTDVDLILENMDVFILPSRSEGLPIAILEAMREGLIIVSSKVGGMPYVIENNVDGILIESSIESICNAIVNIVNKNYDLNTMSEKCRNKFQKLFTIEAMAEKYSNIINSL